METNHLNIIRNIPLFSGLSGQDKNAFLKDGAIHPYPCEKYLFKQNDPLKFFYIVCSGIVREFRETLNESEITIDIHNTGDILCKTEMFLPDNIHRTNAIAVDNVYIMKMPVEQFRENLERNCIVSGRLLRSLAQFAFMRQLEVE